MQRPDHYCLIGSLGPDAVILYQIMQICQVTKNYLKIRILVWIFSWNLGEIQIFLVFFRFLVHNFLLHGIVLVKMDSGSSPE